MSAKELYGDNAYSRGVRAYRTGKAARECPSHKNIDHDYDWLEGYRTARIDSEVSEYLWTKRTEIDRAIRTVRQNLRKNDRVYVFMDCNGRFYARCKINNEAYVQSKDVELIGTYQGKRTNAEIREDLKEALKEIMQ